MQEEVPLPAPFPFTACGAELNTRAFLGTDPKDEPVTSVLPTRALAQHATNGFGLASLNAMPQQADTL